MRSPAALPTTAGVTLDAVDELLAREGAELASLWSSSIVPGPTDVLGEDLPTWLGTLVRTGGKRLRPTMCHWGFVAAGGQIGGPQYADVVRMAAALETLHVFALIHDDVMDGSDTRRGAPAAHVRAADVHRRSGGHGPADEFGRNMAILLGDLAHAEADRLVATLPGPLRQDWFEMCVELIAGQRADLTGAASGRRDLAHAQLVARLKSGAYTVERPLLFGAAAAGAPQGVRSTLAAYGRHLGDAFALRDDVLGIWGDPAVTGKPAGDDLRSGKATVIVGLARERLTGAAAAALERIGTPAARAGDVELLQRALVDTGVHDRVERMIADSHQRALAALEADGLDPVGAAGLRDVAQKIAWRDR
ncbi:polyprenyl synthetase family protein [Mariniluteicoccus flavus]